MEREEARRVLDAMWRSVQYGDQITAEYLSLGEAPPSAEGSGEGSPPHIMWHAWQDTVILFGRYTAEQLEAIAWWISHPPGEEE